MSENFEERLSELFGDSSSSYDEKYHRQREYLKRHNKAKRN